MQNLAKQQRQTNVILEDLNKKFDAFGESLDYVRQRVDNLEEKITALEEGVGELLSDMKEVKQEIKEIKEKLSQKVDRHEYIELKGRVDKLENYVKKYITKNKARRIA